MPSDTGHRLFIQRQRLATARIGADPDAPAQRALQPGQARLAIEHFALTANNITYAAFGEAMKYWQFFPAPEPGEGCLPVWGFATVVESWAEGVDVGRRVWGYFPAGSHLVVTPGRVNAGGFTDAAPHRAELAAVYNHCAWCDADPGWQPALEGLQAVLRPLFITSFLIDDFLAEANCFGATQVLLSSASSKTAYATAFCLAQRRGQPGAPRVLGLTSPGKLDFTRSLGCYDAVLPYDTLATLDPATPTVYVDFAGNAALRRAVHEHFAGTLAYSASIGGTHWDALAAAGTSASLPGPRPTLFFAPAQVKKRTAPPPEGWGREGLERRVAQAWSAFTAAATAGEPWVQISQREGAEAVLAAYTEVLNGQSDARLGLMLTLA
ncbi:hypothetical protein IP87_07125 [beta proteobacterium AAP121]|nr:hypothetical protein IP80_17640 [beta proteobacterium AAP65]KPF98882.1 hypothetical protein IP87_07125 [beta proteobacterium AAP121]